MVGNAHPTLLPEALSLEMSINATAATDVEQIR
jgi:hypothetical protein